MFSTSIQIQHHAQTKVDDCSVFSPVSEELRQSASATASGPSTPGKIAGTFTTTTAMGASTHIKVFVL